MKQIKNLFSKFFRKKEEKKEPVTETVLFSGKPLEEDFYSTVKLKTGEEIFAKVMASKDEDKTMLLLSSPITITELKNRRGLNGYKVEPWLKTTKDSLFIIDIDESYTDFENSFSVQGNIGFRLVFCSLRSVITDLPDLGLNLWGEINNRVGDYFEIKI